MPRYLKLLIILLILGSYSCKKNEKVNTPDVAVVTPGFFHNVYFYLNPKTTNEQIEIFEEGLKSLGEIESLIDYHVGKPAMTPRDVVDNSYQYSIITSFKDKNGHDAYQVDPIHDNFRNVIEGIVDSVRIYDSLVQ